MCETNGRHREKNWKVQGTVESRICEEKSHDVIYNSNFSQRKTKDRGSECMRRHALCDRLNVVKRKVESPIQEFVVEREGKGQL